MTFLKLKEPIPVSRNEEFTPFAFSKEWVSYLPIPDRVESPPVLDVLERRQTHRTFRALNRSGLSSLLWHSAKTHEMRRREDGCFWQHRAVPSAGGCHPIHILVLPPKLDGSTLVAYDSVAHALIELRDVLPSTIRNFRNEVEQIVRPQDGTILIFAADYSQTYRSYQNAESLVWRDAGVLLMGLAIVSEAFELNFCPLGTTADAFVEKAFGSPCLGGVGACIVGAR